MSVGKVEALMPTRPHIGVTLQGPGMHLTAHSCNLPCSCSGTPASQQRSEPLVVGAASALPPTEGERERSPRGRAARTVLQ